MQLHEALSQIASIRASLAASERFQGYRALPVAITGALAVSAAILQTVLLSNPTGDLDRYLTLWLSTAVVSIGVTSVRIARHDWNSPNPLTRELTRMAIIQFVPCLIAGGLVTLALARHAAEIAWVLPGLWQVLFAMGLFSSCRLLPRPIFWIGAFYLLAGTLNLALAEKSNAFSPWSMGLPFGLGQFATAAILYWDQERVCDDTESDIDAD